MTAAPGGRVSLRLEETSATAVRYEGAVSTADRRWPLSACIALGDGAVSLAPGDGTPPGWLLDLARAILRTAARAHRSGVAFPRRLNRWRAGPEAGPP